MFADGAEYVDQRFTRIQAHTQRFTRIRFDGCTFEQSSLIECEVYHCVFVDCRFSGCDLSLLKVTNSRFTDVRFTDCKLIGVDWTQTGDAAASRMGLSVNFERCVLNYASFFGMPLKGSDVQACTAQEVDFAEADLSDACCRDTDFARSKFLHTNLSRADLRGATGYAISPSANTIRKARFSLPEAVSLLNDFDIRVE